MKKNDALELVAVSGITGGVFFAVVFGALSANGDTGHAGGNFGLLFGLVALLAVPAALFALLHRLRR